MNAGLVIVITGDGKGKTTASFGQALRAAGHGQKVSIIQFLKGDAGYGETRAIAAVPGVKVSQFGNPYFVRPDNIRPEDVHAAEQGLEAAAEQLRSGEYDLVILDEVNVAMAMGLLAVERVIDAIRKRAPGTTVVLTGRGAPEAIVELADTVSEIRNVKHHYEQGVSARAGIEY